MHTSIYSTFHTILIDLQGSQSEFNNTIRTIWYTLKIQDIVLISYSNKLVNLINKLVNFTVSFMLQFVWYFTQYQKFLCIEFIFCCFFSYVYLVFNIFIYYSMHKMLKTKEIECLHIGVEECIIFLAIGEWTFRYSLKTANCRDKWKLFFFSN